MREKKCVIFCAAEFSGLLEPVSPGDLVIAADGGLRHTQALGLRPDVVLGDFDSLGYVPENARVSYGVYVAIEGELSGLFAVSYEKTRSAAAGLTTLSAYRGLQCALVSDDFMLTAGFMKAKFGVKTKRFLLPDYETRGQLRQKQAQPDSPTLLMTTSLGLAPNA